MKKHIVLLVLGIIFIIFPFCLNYYNIWRLICLILGILLVMGSLLCKKKKSIFSTFMMFFLIVILCYDLDLLLLYKFNHVPIFVYELKSSDQVRSLNSFFYRIYDCGEKFVIDYGYDLKYACDVNDLEELDINDFLKEPLNSFKEYKNKFVKIKGKISSITGNESIGLSLYSYADNQLNGYVVYNTDYTLEINLEDDLSNYRIYDIITVIGRVERIDKDGKYKIILEDSVLIPSDIYTSYTFEVADSNIMELKPLIKNKDYYLYGISSINVKYSDEVIYELSYLLTDLRITWDDLIDGTNALVFKNIEEEIIARKYELEKYTLLDCSNGKKIIANKNWKIDDHVCGIESVE